MSFKRIFKSFLLHYIVGGVVCGAASMFLLLAASGISNTLMVPLWLGGSVLIQLFWYLLWKKKLDSSVLAANGFCFLLIALVTTVLIVIAGGNTESSLMLVLPFLHFPYLATWFFCLMMVPDLMVLGVPLLTLTAFLIPMALMGYRPKRKQLIAFASCLAVLAGISVISYVNRPQARYGGHGFDYMHGYSTTDFTEYTVTNPKKLARLDGPAALTIADNYPVLDGAEACYPLYSALALETYADIAQYEADAADAWTNGRYVQFTNSVVGFKRLLDGDCDIFFGARPSAQQLWEAEEEGVTLSVTPIGREAFVFFVEAASPMEDISSEALRDIYAGKITNWAQVGGPDLEIAAFQRPSGSGSQTMMEYFMGDTPLKEPQTYEVVGGMGDSIRRVAEYADDKGSLGYSFRYFVEELGQEKGVKLLKVDGVAPTLENIKNGTYPLTVPLVIVTNANTQNPNVASVLDFLLSPQGQELVEKTGYAGLG